MFKLISYFIKNIIEQPQPLPPHIDYEKALKKFERDKSRKQVKNIEKWDHKLTDRWIGREIEYRNSEPLRISSTCFRGRIVKILPANYAIVEAAYVTRFHVKTYYLPRHKRSYKKEGSKFPWQPLEKKILHQVRFMGGRWKHVGD